MAGISEMKPMPYELVGPVEHTIPNGMCPNVYGCPACLEQIQRAQNPKRLTDAECAAEYHRANAEATQRFYEWEIGIRSSMHVESVFAQLEDREDTWERFATTPHAAEAGQ